MQPRKGRTADTGSRAHSRAKKASQKGPSCGSPLTPTTKSVADTSERPSAPSATTREALITPALSAVAGKVVRGARIVTP